MLHFLVVTSDFIRKSFYVTDEEGNKWEKSSQSNYQILKTHIKRDYPTHRYCYFDWHYKLGVTKTLEPYEIEAMLAGKSTKPSAGNFGAKRKLG